MTAGFDGGFMPCRVRQFFVTSDNSMTIESLENSKGARKNEYEVKKYF